MPLVAGGGELGVDGQSRADGDAHVFGDFFHMAGAEDVMHLAALVALEAGHVLHQTQHRHVHHLRHAGGLFDDHLHQLLRRGDEDDPVHRQGLEEGEGHIARSRRHVHEHIVHIAPHDVRPELLDRAGDDRAAPDHGVGLVFQEQVEADDADARLALGGDDAVVRAHQLGVDVERLGDGGAGDVGVEDGRFIAAAAGVTARSEVTSDLPTPPLPLTTPMTF